MKRKPAVALSFTKNEAPQQTDIESCLTTSDGDFTWVNIQSCTPQKAAKKILKLPAAVLSAVTANETRPRSEWLANGLLINLRCLNKNTDEDPEDMVGVRVWLTERCIITSHRRELSFMKTWLQKVNTLDFQSPVDVLHAVLRETLEEMTDLACALDDQIDELEDLDCSNREARRKLADIRRKIILIRRYLMPQREALLRIPTEKMAFLNDLDKQRFREAADSTVRILEDLDAARERTTALQEELINKVQEDMNRKMYVLAIVTMIFMPLAFITGLLGINVGGIPGTEFHWSFTIVCGLLAGIMVIEYFILKHLKWI